MFASTCSRPRELSAVSESKRDSVDYRRLACKLGFQLRMAERATYRHFVQIADVTPVQYSLLALVADNEGLPQGVLGEILNLDRATTMAVMEKLVEAGWVERRRSADDRRRYAVYLSVKGSRKMVELEKRVCESDGQFTRRFSEEELRTLTRFLERVYGSPSGDFAGKDVVATAEPAPITER